MRTRSLALSMAVLASLAAPPAWATGIPVFDAGNLAQAVQQYQKQKQQLMQLQQQYETMRDQYNALQRQTEMLRGASGIGDLFMDSASREARRWAAPTWGQTLEVLEEGASPDVSSELRELAEQTQERFNRVSHDERFYGELGEASEGIQERAERYRERGRRLHTQRATSEAALNRTRERLDQIESLTASIENAEDPKEILDLQARIDAQTAMLLNEVIRQQALSNVIASGERIRTRNWRATQRDVGGGGDLPVPGE